MAVDAFLRDGRKDFLLESVLCFWRGFYFKKWELALQFIFHLHDGSSTRDLVSEEVSASSHLFQTKPTLPLTQERAHYSRYNFEMLLVYLRLSAAANFFSPNFWSMLTLIMLSEKFFKKQEIIERACFDTYFAFIIQVLDYYHPSTALVFPD